MMIRFSKILCILAFLPFFGVPPSRAQENLYDEAPEAKVLRQFFVALELKDAESIRKLALPNPNLDILWAGKKPSIEKLNGIFLSIGRLKFQPIKAGEEFDAGGGNKVKADERFVNERMALVRRVLPGQSEPPFRVVKFKDSWRVDASGVARFFLQRAGRQPMENLAAAWRSLASLDALLKPENRFWATGIRDFASPHTAAFFRKDDTDKTAVLYPRDPKSPSIDVFGAKALSGRVKFVDGFLDHLRFTVYERTEGEDTDNARDMYKALDKALRSWAGTRGVTGKRSRNEERTLYTRPRHYVRGDTVVTLETISTRKRVRSKKTGRKRSVYTPQSLAVVARELDAAHDPRANAAKDERSDAYAPLDKLPKEFLERLGTPVGPQDSAFWHQTKVDFLGWFVEKYKAHWTTELVKGERETFRCCYIQTAKEKMQGKQPVCFIENDPLTKSSITLFGYPVVAMVAVFDAGRLAEFRFDYWNKGDGDIDDKYDNRKARLEKSGKRDYEALYNSLRKGGVKFKRGGAPKSSVSKVRAKRSWFRAGPTTVAFLPMKGEYYTVGLQSSEYLLTKEEAPKEKKKGGRSLREKARKDVVRIGSEEEAGKHPGVVKVGDVFMVVPMVDQGPKGYCGPATLARIVQYYGRDTTMNEMAAMMETMGAQGTLLREIRDATRKVTRKLHMSFKEEKLLKKNRRDDRRYIDKWVEKCIVKYASTGSPIFWTVPKHLRLIVGYNARTREILYSDSWGKPGYDRMSYDQCAKLTEALFIIK
ncbi:MAG: C39 family peptidase [Lentisphaeria bacterium]|nr:C39 family peptidase [Lentisphaeria bacterium]